MSSKALLSTFLLVTMEWWQWPLEESDWIPGLQTRAPRETALSDIEFIKPIRVYVRAYVWWHNRQGAAEEFGVSPHTLWRFLEGGHMGRALPRAVLGAVGGSVEALEAAAQELVLDLAAPSMDARRDGLRPLPQGLEDGLLLCGAPLATVEELSRIG